MSNKKRRRKDARRQLSGSAPMMMLMAGQRNQSISAERTWSRPNLPNMPHWAAQNDRNALFYSASMHRSFEPKASKSKPWAMRDGRSKLAGWNESGGIPMLLFYSSRDPHQLSIRGPWAGACVACSCQRCGAKVRSPQQNLLLKFKFIR